MCATCGSRGLGRGVAWIRWDETFEDKLQFFGISQLYILQKSFAWTFLHQNVGMQLLNFLSLLGNLCCRLSMKQAVLAMCMLVHKNNNSRDTMHVVRFQFCMFTIHMASSVR